MIKNIEKAFDDIKNGRVTLTFDVNTAYQGYSDFLDDESEITPEKEIPPFHEDMALNIAEKYILTKRSDYSIDNSFVADMIEEELGEYDKDKVLIMIIDHTGDMMNFAYRLTTEPEITFNSFLGVYSSLLDKSEENGLRIRKLHMGVFETQRSKGHIIQTDQAQMFVYMHLEQKKHDRLRKIIEALHRQTKQYVLTSLRTKLTLEFAEALEDLKKSKK